MRSAALQTGWQRLSGGANIGQTPVRRRSCAWALACLWVACLCVLAPQPALADLFTVSNVRTDVTDENAVLAREKALAEGQKKALVELMKRLSLSSEWDKLPTLGEDFNVTKYVRSFQVQKERTTPTRYLADLSVRFVPKAVEELMRSKNVTPFTTPASKAVLLPVFQSPDGLQLWEDANPWRQGLQSVNLTDTLTPMSLPLGDIFDVSAISAEDAIEPNLVKLRAFAERQGVDDVVVAYALPVGPALQISMTRYIDIGESEETLRKNWQNPAADGTGHVAADEKADDQSKNGAPSETPTGLNPAAQDSGGAGAEAGSALPGAVTVVGEDGQEVPGAAQTQQVDLAVEKMKELREMMPSPASVTMTVSPSPDGEPLYRYAGEQLVQQSENWWKTYEAPKQKLKTYALRVDIPFSSYWEWKDIRKKLLDNTLLTGSSLRAIAPSGAVVTLYYQRPRDEVAKSLTAQNLYLEKKWGRWELLDTPPAPPMPDPAEATGTDGEVADPADGVNSGAGADPETPSGTGAPSGLNPAAPNASPNTSSAGAAQG